MGEREPTFDVELDCRKLLCPMPIYKTSRAMSGMAAGQVVRVLCTDPGSLRDFPAFARQSGHELVDTRREEDVHVFYVRKVAS